MNLSKKALHRPSILNQAAVLPWRRAEGGIEVILITSLGTGRWVLPKGALMPGESPRAAARREAMEEAGLDGHLGLRPLGTFCYEKRLDSGTQLCSVEVYPLEFVTQRDVWPEQGMRKTEWFWLAQAATNVREDELRELILTFDPARRRVPKTEAS